MIGSQLGGYGRRANLVPQDLNSIAETGPHRGVSFLTNQGCTDFADAVVD